MYDITITFPSGPTIMASDAEPVEIRRAAFTDDQVDDYQRAALVLGATSVDIKKQTRR